MTTINYPPLRPARPRPLRYMRLLVARLGWDLQRRSGFRSVGPRP